MWPIVGHGWVVDMWQNSIRQGRVRHAYLLNGPAHIGKRTLALTFAQALNCVSDSRPCGQCRSCQKIVHGTHPDVRVIEGLGGSIKIEQIRELQNEIALSAHESPWKVYVLRDADQATPEAANCLLKTLEEPPQRVVLILTATRPNMLLPTVVSRCQVLPLRPLAPGLIAQVLVDQWQAKPERAELLARLSGGRIGWAIVALQDESILAKRAEAMADLQKMMAAHRYERLEYAAKLGAQRDDALRALDLWQTWWRDLLLTKVRVEERTANFDFLDELRYWANLLTVDQINSFLARLNSTARRVEQDANARLALESLLLNLPLMGQRTNQGISR